MAVKKNLQCIGFLLVIVGFAAATLEQFDYGYHAAARGWLKLHLKPATWTEARLICAKEGAVLASPETDELEQAIRDALSQREAPTKVFTGVHDTYATGHYYSMEGVPLSKMTVFSEDEEPTKSREKNCFHLTKTDNDGSKITRGSCSDALPFVCLTKKRPQVVHCGTDDKDYKYEARTNRCYKFHTEAKNWTKAFATCDDEGGHLAIINSETEAQIFRELYAEAKTSAPDLYEVIFVGFTDLGDHKNWLTIHGQTLEEAGYNKWNPGQPEDLDSRCGAMYGKEGLLDDYYCDRSCAFICEIDVQNFVKKTANEESEEHRWARFNP